MAWAQAGGKKPAADPALAECVAANRQALVDLTQSLDEARRRHVLSPLVVTRLQGLQAQVGRLRESLPRSTRSLADCEGAALAIVTEKEKLQRIVGEPAAGETPVGGVAAAASAPAASAPAEGRTVAATAAPAMASAPVPPAVSPEACRADQVRSYNELAQGFASVAQGRTFAADKAGVVQSLSERLTQLRNLIVDPAAPGWNCAQVTQRLAQVRADLQPLLAAAQK